MAFLLCLLCLVVSPAVHAQSPTTVNDTDTSLVYAGSGWGYYAHRSLGDVSDDVHATAVNGDSVSYTFSGTDISYVTETAPDEGNVQVFLDGTLQTIVNCYSATRKTQQTVWSRSGFPPGTYTLELVKQDGGFMLLDALQWKLTPNFLLGSTSHGVSFGQGTSGTVGIGLNSTGGFTGSVALTASSLPTGVTASFAPASLSGNAISTLTLTASATAAIGPAAIMITGTSGSLVHTVSFRISVTANPILTSIAVSPSAATLTTGGTQTFTAVAKDQNGVALATQPTFIWTLAGVGAVTSAGVYSAGTIAGSATVKATSGTVSGTVAVTINAASSSVSLSSLTLSLSSVKAGDTCSGAVQITGTSSVPVTVSLASSDPSVVVPSNVTVPANQTLATFSVTTNTIDPIQAVITASYGGTSQSATLNVLPAINFYCVATGSSKITSYWTGISGISGYNVYRSVTEAGPYSQVNTSPITTSDPGPGLTDRYMYSDNGLTTGTEYFYYVTSATGSATSNDDSAIPSSDAISWDSGDANLIVTQVRSMASANLTEDEPAVGLLTIAGPDGVIYKGFTDGTPAAAYASPGHYNSNTGTFVYLDGSEVPAPPDAPNDNLVGLSSSMTQKQLSNALIANTICPLQTQILNKTYSPTVRYGGILREVQAQAGFRGMASSISLPNPFVTDSNQQVFLDGRNNGRSIFPTDDTGYVYTGGTAYQVHHRRGTGVSYVDIGEIDAGLELFRTADPDRPGYIPYASQPGTMHGTFDSEILGDPLADGSASASLPYYQGPYVYVQGQPLMTFKVAGYGSVPDKTILLSFHQGDGGLVFTYDKLKKLRHYVNDVTYVDGAERGWTKSACIVIKRMNTIAQGFKKSLTPPYVYTPVPDGPGGQFKKTGSYFLGVDWGDPSAILALDGVNLLGFGQWSSDPSVTWTEGSYPSPSTPSPGNPYVGKLVHNAFSWEQYVNLKTSP